MSLLDLLADSDTFTKATKSEQAEMVVWAILKSEPSSQGVSLANVCASFSAMHLPTPNSSRVRDALRKSRNIRSIPGSLYAPTREFSRRMEDTFPLQQTVSDDVLSIDDIAVPRFVDEVRVRDLKAMMRAYAHLFLMENSIREMISSVLSQKLGVDWWTIAASSSMKRKHDERTKNEEKKKWAPTRAEFGPLYALDWPDLVTLIRKYENDFEPIIKDTKFIHKLEDLGAFRNVVAHNGALRDEDDFNLVRIYFNHWVKQVSS